MTPTIEAHITEIDGAFYEALLHAIPRVGELIDFHSFLDATTGHNAFKYYEVVQVIHKVHDVTDKVPRANGYHFVTVVVKPSTSNEFKYSPT